LWAASPLMKNGAQLGASKNGKTYDYDQAYAAKAAEAFGELLNLTESGQAPYALAQFKYKDIYNHERASGATSCFSDIFYTTKQNWKMPGSVEAIFRGPSADYNGSNWNTSKVFGPKVDKVVAHDNVIHQPTANLVEMYGMANGLPITDPASLQPLPNGQEGLILIGGHQVMKEYYDEPAKTAEAIAQIDGVRYYKSGDIGYIDDDGFLFITDRLSRFAKIGGEMISLGAVESAVGEILGESAIYSCVNLKDEKKGEKIVLLYVGEASEDEISRRLKDSALAPIMQPSVVKKVEQIPVLGSGKVNLKAVKDLAIELRL